MTSPPTASVSLDLDNLWAYLKTHGDPAWRSRPSFLDTAVPRVLDLFAEHRLTATVFVVGADAERDDGARAVASLAAAGHEIGNHSWGHEPWLHRYDRVRLTEELERTEEAIVAAGAPRPRGFRGPGFSVTPTLLALLAERGYAYDTSTLPTWIGPLARRIHNRGAGPGGEHGDEDAAARADLFGPVTDAFLSLRPHRSAAGPVELPVTTMPLLRAPIHGSYLLALYDHSPRVARAYFRTALRLCRARRIGPTVLVHPTDLLDRREAPGMEFFPGMAVPGDAKTALLGWVLATLRAHFEVVGTGEHVARVCPSETQDPARPTIRSAQRGRE